MDVETSAKRPKGFYVDETAVVWGDVSLIRLTILIGSYLIPTNIGKPQWIYYFGLMKKLYVLSILLSCALITNSQVNGSLHTLDADGNPTDAKSAKFLAHKYQINDTCWQYDLYNYMGPMIKSERFWDEGDSQMNGTSYYYNEKGLIDSLVNFRRGKKNGESWSFGAEKYRVKYLYQNDTLISVLTPDSLKKDSSIVYGDERQSEFPGGLQAWYDFLNKNVQYPKRAQKAIVQGKVVIHFMVNENGDVIDPYLSRSVEYSIDEEALRIIRISGKWEPAFQNGHIVKSYKSQPLYFRLVQTGKM